MRLVHVTTLIALCCNCGFTEAFAPPISRKANTATVSPFWRLQYVDDEAEVMIAFSDTILNQPALDAMPSDGSLPQNRNGVSAVDMSHFESSFQGLSKPTEAGMALAVFIAIGMVVMSPDVPLASMSHNFAEMCTNKLELNFLPVLNTKYHTLISEGPKELDNFASQYVSRQLLNVEAVYNKVETYAIDQTCQLNEHCANIVSQWSDRAAMIKDKVFQKYEDIVIQASQVKSDLMRESAKVERSISLQVETFLNDKKSQLQNFQTIVDEKIINDGRALHGQTQSLVQQSQAHMMVIEEEIEDMFIIPFLDNNNIFWDSFDLELAKEINTVHNGVESLYFASLEVVEETYNRLIDWGLVKLPQVIHEAFESIDYARQYASSEFFTTQNVALPEAIEQIKIHLEDIHESVMKLSLEAQGNSQIFLRDCTLKEIFYEEVFASFTENAKIQGLTNLHAWKAITDSGIQNEKEALLGAYKSYATHLSSTSTQIFQQLLTILNRLSAFVAMTSEELQSFQQEADNQMIVKGSEWYHHLMDLRQMVQETAIDERIAIQSRVFRPLAMSVDSLSNQLELKYFSSKFIPSIQHAMAHEMTYIQELAANVVAWTTKETSSLRSPGFHDMIVSNSFNHESIVDLPNTIQSSDIAPLPEQSFGLGGTSPESQYDILENRLLHFK